MNIINNKGTQNHNTVYLEMYIQCITHLTELLAGIVNTYIHVRMYLNVLSQQSSLLYKQEGEMRLAAVQCTYVGIVGPPLSNHVCTVGPPLSNHVCTVGPRLSNHVCTVGPPLSNHVCTVGPPLSTTSVQWDLLYPPRLYSGTSFIHHVCTVGPRLSNHVCTVGPPLSTTSVQWDLLYPPRLYSGTSFIHHVCTVGPRLSNHVCSGSIVHSSEMEIHSKRSDK